MARWYFFLSSLAISLRSIIKKKDDLYIFLRFSIINLSCGLNCAAKQGSFYEGGSLNVTHVSQYVVGITDCSKNVQKYKIKNSKNTIITLSGRKIVHLHNSKLLSNLNFPPKHFWDFRALCNIALCLPTNR